MSKMVSRGYFPVIVDYDKSEADILLRGLLLGLYDHIDKEILSECLSAKLTGEKRVAIELFHFDRDVNYRGARERLDRRGYRPAQLYEFLTLNENFPSLPRTLRLVLLCSLFGKKAFLYTYNEKDVHGDRLSLYYKDAHRGLVSWGSLCWFPAVKK